MTDLELVTAAQQGDQAAFGALVEKYQAMAYSQALRMVGNPDDAAKTPSSTPGALYRASRGRVPFPPGSIA